MKEIVTQSMFYPLPKPLMTVVNGGVLATDTEKVKAWKRVTNMCLILALPLFVVDGLVGYIYREPRLFWLGVLAGGIHLVWLGSMRWFPNRFPLFIRLCLWQNVLGHGLIFPIVAGGVVNAWFNQLWSIFMLAFGVMFYPRWEAWLVFFGCAVSAILVLLFVPSVAPLPELPSIWNNAIATMNFVSFAYMVSVVLDIASVERQTTLNQLADEKSRGDALLRNILPSRLADELINTGVTLPAKHEETSVMFLDIVGFTQMSSTIPPDRLVRELNELFAAFDDMCAEEGVEKIKTIGDAYMAAAGVPDAAPDHAERCARLALRILDFIKQRNQKVALKCEVRIGIHSGPVVSGVVGKRKYAFDIWGDTVNIASRMESAGQAGKINVSAYTYDLLMSKFAGEHRGKIEIRGKGAQDMYFISQLLPA